MSTSEQLFGDAHVDRYLQTDGAEGHQWRKDTTILLLFTTGAKTGEQRINALIYRPWQDAYLIVASKGGSDAPPAWYLNLQAHPDEVEIQILGERFAVNVHDADDSEKPAMWEEMVAAWPDYAKYQDSTDRVIPVVVLERK